MPHWMLIGAAVKRDSRRDFWRHSRDIDSPRGRGDVAADLHDASHTGVTGEGEGLSRRKGLAEMPIRDVEVAVSVDHRPWQRLCRPGPLLH